LAVTIPQLLNLGVSGYPFNGADVGGFIGCPDAELFGDWMELGALQPFFRNHSHNEGCRREPWLFGPAVEARARAGVERRYRLLPYLYTLFEESSRTGLPVMRPLWLEYPQDAAVAGVDTAYLLGADLLIAPKLVAGAARYRVTLPRGDWYDTETLAPVEGGPYDIEPQGSSVRLFARAGAIIPEAPVLRRAELSGKLTLTVWPGASCHGALYVDDGQSFAYASGKSRRVAFACEAAAKSLSVQATSQGEYPAWWQEVELVIHAVPSAPSSVALADGKPLPHSYDAAKKTLVVKLAGGVTDFKLGVGW
jgi:alpha-glucosidase